MAHQWQKFHRGVQSALKVAAGVGAIAVAAHGIHRGLRHNIVSPHSHGPRQVEVVHHGIAKTVKF